MERKHPPHPGDTQGADTEERDHHRNDGASDTSQRSADAVHHCTARIAGIDHIDALDAPIYNCRIRVVDTDEFPAEKGADHTEKSDGNAGSQYAVFVALYHPVILLGSVILSGEAGRRLIEAEAGGIEDSLDVHSGGVSCHGGTAEGVDCSLDDKV